MLIQLAEVLNVSVSDLLGKEIQVEEKQNELDVIALELSKLNELLATYGGKASQWKKKIGKIVGTIIIIIIFFAIYDSWAEMFREFGANLYHMING